MTTTNANAPVHGQRVLPMPEWLTRKDERGGAWEVQAGPAERGEAWTNLTLRQMRVPVGADETSRVVRAHEMTHAKVSPRLTAQDGRYGASNESIVVAEEYRVNTLVARAGFDIDQLVDGSEQRSGEIAGQTGMWNEAVRQVMATAGTKGATQFIKGVRKHNPEMADALNESLKEMKKFMRRLIKRAGKNFASTQPDDRWTKDGEDVTHPFGFRVTIELARFLDRLLVHDNGDDDIDGDDGPNVPNAEDVKDRATQNGYPVSAKLVEKILPKPRSVAGRLGRKRVASQTGVNPRNMGRLLTDPERRVFDRRIRGNGGMVVVDQSGSMRLTEGDLWKIIESAPGCMIIGYSHQAGSIDVPNVWILADRGKVVNEIPSGAGNGVDVPALRFALKRRRNNEAFVWVCDGTVTDKDDHVSPSLAEECAKLVIKHRIHQVKDVKGAVEALAKAGKGQRLPMTAVGNVARTKAWLRREV